MVCAQIERERAHTKNKRGKPKRESTQRTRWENKKDQKERAHKEQEGQTKKREETKNKRGKPRSGRSAEKSPGEDMVCAQMQL